MRMRTGGRPGPGLLLLHGLGATSEVWDGLIAHAERSWPGRWYALDLPGHGGSEPLADYTFTTMSASVAAAVAAAVDGPVTVLGHSLGGVLALELASDRHPVPVLAAVGVGIKIAWTPDELARAAALADRPAATFATADQAVARHLKVAGLTGLIAPDDPRALAGVRRTGEGWRLALDQRAFGVGAPDMPALLAAAQCPVVLAAGEHDPMVDEAALRALAPDAVTLHGLGHNAHVEGPALVGRLVPAWQDSANGLG